MDAVSDSTTQEVVVMSSAQVGKSLVLLAIIGFHVDQDPAPILMLQPTLEMAEAFSKDRIAPMIRDTPALKGKIADPRSRDSGNTLLHKRFAGGSLTLAGANSPASLASRPIRIVLADEVDRYPTSAGAEGDPVSLARKRSATFWNRKIVLVSTPTVKGASRIEAAWEGSDQRRYHVPCPSCRTYQVLEWDRVNYPDGRPDEAAIACVECGTLMLEADKPRMLREGEWRATAPSNGVAGFHLSELYSPWRTWADVARDYERAKDHPEQLKTWVNTSLGETYQEAGEAPEWARLVDKREKYPIGTVPEPVVFLTCGIDVQRDRLELEVVGWAEGKRSWSVDYRVIDGDTADAGRGGPWAKLREVLLSETWPRAGGGSLPIRFACVDSGFRTTEVYDFCRSVGSARVAPVKGRDDQTTVISQPRPIDRRKDGKASWRGLRLYTLGVNVLKAELYGWLRLDASEDGTDPPGYCHFPEYGEGHFKELTSERVITRLVRGFPRHVWVKTPGVRNEPLDCRNYARAAAAIVGIDRFREKDWHNMRSAAGLGEPGPAEDAPRKDEGASAPPVGPAPRAGVKRRPSSFWR